MAKTVDNGTLSDYDVDTGAGNVGADTQRVTLAADDPAVTSLAAIEAAVGGGLTDTELRATPVPVSGTVTVTDGSGSLTVDGTVTANAGTNLNTSALALEAGGNLAAIATSLAALDNAVAGNEFQVDIVSGSVTVSGTVDLGATDNAVLDAIAASVAAIDTDATTIIGHVDGIEALLGTIDADTGNIVTSVQLLDDAAVVLGTATYTEATSTGLVMAAVRRDADTTLVNTTNEYTPLQVDANGRLKVEAFSGESLPVTLTSTTITGTVAVTQSGTWDEVGINDSGNSITVDAPVGTPAFVRLSDGSSAITTLPVSLAALPASTNTIEVVGDAAHDAALAGNPVRIGARGVSADPTVITTGRTVDVLASLLGKQIVLPYCHPGASETYASPAAVTDTADDEAFAAVASTRHYITGIQVFNGHATTSTEVVIKDGSTVKWRGYAYAAGGGATARFDPPLRGTANTAVNVANITNASSTYFNLQGYQATE